MPKVSDGSLRIECAEVEGDHMTAVMTTDAPPHYVVLNVNIGAGSGHAVALDAERARELFNWLGVQLHRWPHG